MGHVFLPSSKAVGGSNSQEHCYMLETLGLIPMRCIPLQSVESDCHGTAGKEVSHLPFLPESPILDMEIFTGILFLVHGY